MFEWLADWGIGKIIVFVAAAIMVKPLLKFGFYIRQAISDHKSLNEFERQFAEKRRQGCTLTAEGEQVIRSSKRRRLVGFVLAPFGIMVFLILFGLFLPWWSVPGGLVLVVVGFVNVN